MHYHRKQDRYLQQTAGRTGVTIAFAESGTAGWLCSELTLTEGSGKVLGAFDRLPAYQIDTIRFIAAKLFKSGKLPPGQAGDMGGLTKYTFAELIAITAFPISITLPGETRDEPDRNWGIKYH